MGNFGLNAEISLFYDTESRALFVLYEKKMRTRLLSFLLNTRPSEIMLNYLVQFEAENYIYQSSQGWT